MESDRVDLEHERVALTEIVVLGNPGLSFLLTGSMDAAFPFCTPEVTVRQPDDEQVDMGVVAVLGAEALSESHAPHHNSDVPFPAGHWDLDGDVHHGWQY